MGHGQLISKSIFTGEPQIVADNDLGILERETAHTDAPNKNSRHLESNEIASYPKGTLWEGNSMERDAIVGACTNSPQYIAGMYLFLDTATGGDL
jgi:hypothetical protein